MASDGRGEPVATADQRSPDGGFDPDPSASPSGGGPAPLWRAVVAWLLLLLLVGGVIALFWPRMQLLMRHDVPSVVPGGANRAANGAANSGTNAAGGMPLASPFHPKPAPKVYPPCTETRTDSCIQDETK